MSFTGASDSGEEAMQWQRTGLIVSLVIASSAPASAVESFHTGSEALELCKKDDSWCIGLVAGFAEAMLLGNRTGGGRREICFGDQVDTIKMRDIVVTFLEDHPESGSLPVAESLQSAMVGAYPCT
jgi:hypothetical protein